MKIIVTGGAGFIASHIVDAYFKAGHEVVVIDNLTSGFKRNLNPKAKFYKADIRNLGLIEKIFKREQPQIVNHHAALISVVESVGNPVLAFETNVVGTLNLLSAFGKYGKIKGGRFIFASTGGAMYGEFPEIPADERTEVNPLSPYGFSKLLAEKTIEFYSRHFGFSFLNLRYVNVYGPRQNPKGEAGVVAIFIRLMGNGARPTIFGDGTKTRDYLYVDDIVKANLLALRRGRNETINLGWGKEISDQMIFDTIAKELNFPKKPIYAPCRKGEVRRIALDAKRAKKILGWQPKISLKGGIRKTIKAI
jgi:UDP-glucose 4-epimerase